MTPDTPTRRRILGALGSVGLLYVGVDRGRAALGLTPVETNQQMQIETAGPMPDVALDWPETLNGEVQEDTDLGSVTAGNTGDVGLVVDESVVPGDEGTLTMRATLVDGGETAAETAALFLRFLLSNTAENGVSEPEEKAGDDPTSDEGELQNFTEVTIWKDTGIGTGNGSQEPFEDVIADGTLSSIEGQVGDGHRLHDGCLSVGDSVYVSLRWRVPSDAGNIIQGDSAAFAVGFDPRACESQ
ncbi:MAG: hypothetical protein ABEJ82_10405 [Haloplanus sp.]